MFKRVTIFVYGLACYAVFFATFLYAIGFIGDFLVPRTLDSAGSSDFGTALTIDLALLSLFALQHSGMARAGFKRWLTRFVPEPAERSTYVLMSSLALILLFWYWQPLGGMVWDVQDPAWRITLYSLYGFGWGLVLLCTFLIDHFDLFGLRQVWLQLVGREYTPLGFRTPLLYRMVRHPLYVGWLLAFWATPTMTLTHLFFAVVTTAYILVAIQLEERDLIRMLGNDYRAYRERVPMLVPWIKSRAAAEERIQRQAHSQQR